jgi:ATP-dependent helicase/nuclease subunit A
VLRRAERSWAIAPTAIGAHDGDPDDDSAPPVPAPGGDDVDDHARARRRGATARGRAVHGVLESVPLDGTGPIDPGLVKDLAARMAEAEDADPADVEARAWSGLRSRTLVEARAARRRWREVPVAAALEGRVVEGYVDLLFERADGTLVVVDWKTDAVRSASEVVSAARRHRVQGAAYAGAIQAATGRTVSSVRFVFCRHDGEAADESEITDLADAMEEVRLALRS